MSSLDLTFQISQEKSVPITWLIIGGNSIRRILMRVEYVNIPKSQCTNLATLGDTLHNTFVDDCTRREITLVDAQFIVRWLVFQVIHQLHNESLILGAIRYERIVLEISGFHRDLSDSWLLQLLPEKVVANEPTQSVSRQCHGYCQ